MDPIIFQACTLAAALRLYARTGIKANPAYTPTAMLATASRITGQRFAARDYQGAAAALTAWVATQAQQAQLTAT